MFHALNSSKLTWYEPLVRIGSGIIDRVVEQACIAETIAVSMLHVKTVSNFMQRRALHLTWRRTHNSSVVEWEGKRG